MAIGEEEGEEVSNIPDQHARKPKRFGLRAVASSVIVLAAVMFLIFGMSFTGPWPRSNALDWIAGISMFAFIPAGLLGMILWIVAARRR